MRLLAAVAVLHSHSFAIVSGVRDSQPIVPFLDITVGTFAVHVFFAISGYLICGSAIKGNFFGFLIARCLRIFPALILLVCTTCFIIGPATSELGFAQYFRDPMTWKYLGKNASMIFGARFDLPGVFLVNPLTAMVNGSLWTLPYELRLYFVFSLLCIFASKLSINTTKYLFAFAIMSMLLFHFILMTLVLHTVTVKSYVDFIPADLLYIFLLGSLTRVFGGRICIKSTYFFAVVVLLISLYLYKRSAALPFYYASLSYLLISISFFFSRFIKSTPNDYSYSTYLWAFPIQQCLVFLLPDINVIGLSISSLMIVGLLAHFTWIYVENPMIILSKRLQRKISPHSISKVPV